MADFVEALMGKRLVEKDRTDAAVVLSSLKQQLCSTKGQQFERKLNSAKRRWLLCSDNADNPEVNAVVGELCSLAGANETKGWVIVTSRQGVNALWEGMIADQS